MSTKLSVNLNKIALLRNSRNSGLPSVTRAARLCIAAGADGITVHPRPDQRHIRPQDVHDLRDMLTVEFNIEGNPFEPSFLDLVRTVQPTQCTMVPDDRSQLTSDHGWDLQAHGERLRPIIAELKSFGVRISLFLDPDPVQVSAAHALRADRIELYTGPYAEEFGRGAMEAAVSRYVAAARVARRLGLGINAGHDLSLENLATFLNAVPSVLEVSIGHALIAEALEWGLGETVERYVAICHADRSALHPVE